MTFALEMEIEMEPVILNKNAKTEMVSAQAPVLAATESVASVSLKTFKKINNSKTIFVCFLVQLACGGTSSENCTYLVMAATAAPGLSCDFTVCPASNQICRMRFDFTVYMYMSLTMYKVNL